MSTLSAAAAAGSRAAGSPTVVPPVLYLPVLRPDVEQVTEVQVAIRSLRDGRRALLAYTSLDRLADKCGDHQPWIVWRTEDLGSIKSQQPFDVVIFDLDIPRASQDASHMSIEMVPADLRLLADNHDEASADLVTAIDKLPTTLDGGIVVDDCVAIVDRMSFLVAALAQVHTGMAGVLRAIADGTERVDEDVAATFRLLESELRE